MDGTIAKVVCLFVLLVDTLIFGWLPYFIIKKGGTTPRAVHIRSMIISYLNCFAGGVFLGACLLHLLAEGRETLNEYFKEAKGSELDFPLFEALTAVGFFIIAAVEQVAHRLLYKHHQHADDFSKHSVEESAGSSSAGTGTDSESQSFARNSPTGHYSAINTSGNSHPSGGEYNKGHDHHREVSDALQQVTQVSPLRAFLLLGALSFHTVFDGLAVGLKTTSSEIWEMFTAIIIHKTLVAICLGLQLFIVYKEQVYKAFLWVTFFSLIAPIGVVIGIAITSGSIDDLAEDLVSGILQAIATGTFLYITFFEILREELIDRRGFLRLVVTLIGFGGMALAKALDKD